MSKTAAPRTRNGPRTRERLLGAALVEFQRAGMAAADTGAIVSAAGVAHGTFFFHFPTKEHVLLELEKREEVRIAGEARVLTGYQFDLLVALAERAGRVVSREQLMELVKGETLEAFDRSIDVHVSRIRAAIEDDPKTPRRILTVRGAGYVFARKQDGDGA